MVIHTVQLDLWIKAICTAVRGSHEQSYSWNPPPLTGWFHVLLEQNPWKDRQTDRQLVRTVIVLCSHHEATVTYCSSHWLTVSLHLRSSFLSCISDNGLCVVRERLSSETITLWSFFSFTFSSRQYLCKQSVLIRQRREPWNTSLCFCTMTYLPHLSTPHHFIVMPG